RAEKRERSSVRQAAPSSLRSKSKTVNKRSRVPPNGPQQCWVCAGRGHIANQCFFKGKAYCNLCSRPGHLPKACRMRKFPTRFSRQVHWCAEQDDSDDEGNQEVTISNVQTARCRNHVENSSQRNRTDTGHTGRLEEPLIISNRVTSKARVSIEPAIMLPIIVNGRTVDFELDTGASVSIIDEATWSMIGKPEMRPTKLEATAYNNSPISFEGRCTVELQFKGRVITMEVYVLRTASHPLCGRDMIRGLQIDCGPHVRSVEGKRPYTKEQLREKMKNLLEENQVLFQKGLGKCTTAKVSLKLKQGLEKPKFCRVRPVPLALRPKVEAKLQELVENGTLTRVEHSEWATPLVVVPKPGGKIRLCGDYKVTVNPQLDINQYPLPKPDDFRVVIPKKFRRKVLEVLHHSHYGRNRMTALARRKVWYLGIDKDIQRVAQSCAICATFGNEMRKTPLHPWETPAGVWQRLHLDFAETSDGKRWLVIVDAKSKWPEVVKMGATTVEKTIEKLKDIFSIHGLPEQIVVDNGPQFIAREFKEYCIRRNIELIFIPPYHHNSNGEAERFVQTFKKGYYKGKKSGKTDRSGSERFII
ncbi:integrase core domain protein, partial [Ostertagia ostertagi]